jgi:hypothetical protein
MTTGQLLTADSLFPAQPGVMAYWLSYGNWPLEMAGKRCSSADLDVVGRLMVAESPSLQVHRVVSPVRTQVAENLRQAILSRHFKPGQRLVERELVEATGASRSWARALPAPRLCTLADHSARLCLPARATFAAKRA